jgi:hypothetical protein
MKGVRNRYQLRQRHGAMSRIWVWRVTSRWSNTMWISHGLRMDGFAVRSTARNMANRELLCLHWSRRGRCGWKLCLFLGPSSPSLSDFGAELVSAITTKGKYYHKEQVEQDPKRGIQIDHHMIRDMVQSSSVYGSFIASRIIFCPAKMNVVNDRVNVKRRQISIYDAPWS